MRRSLSIFGLLCCLCGTAALLPIKVLSQPRTVTDVRLDNVEQEVVGMKGYGERLAHLEDISATHTAQLGEIQWWGRWIGMALLAGVIDKLLALAGLGSVSERIQKRQRERLRDAGEGREG